MEMLKESLHFNQNHKTEQKRKRQGVSCSRNEEDKLMLPSCHKQNLKAERYKPKRFL
jgi:hypothetical protein